MRDKLLFGRLMSIKCYLEACSSLNVLFMPDLAFARRFEIPRNLKWQLVAALFLLAVIASAH